MESQSIHIQYKRYNEWNASEAGLTAMDSWRRMSSVAWEGR